MPNFSLQNLDNLSTDSCSGYRVPVSASLDHIEAITVIEGRGQDRAVFKRFPHFRIYGAISAIIQILETTNRDSDRALRAEYSCLLNLTVISFLRNVRQDIMFWFMVRMMVWVRSRLKRKRQVHLGLCKYGDVVCH